MSERKTEFWWASIHGADPEPVEKAEHEGRPCVYTLGCADPFYLDEEPSAVMFVSPDNGYAGPWGRWIEPELKPLSRPKHPSKQLAEAAALAAARAKTPARFHGWRGPR